MGLISVNWYSKAAHKRWRARRRQSLGKKSGPGRGEEVRPDGAVGVVVDRSVREELGKHRRVHSSVEAVDHSGTRGALDGDHLGAVGAIDGDGRVLHRNDRWGGVAEAREERLEARNVGLQGAVGPEGDVGGAGHARHLVPEAPAVVLHPAPKHERRGGGGRTVGPQVAGDHRAELVHLGQCLR